MPKSVLQEIRDAGNRRSKSRDTLHRNHIDRLSDFC